VLSDRLRVRAEMQPLARSPPSIGAPVSLCIDLMAPKSLTTALIRLPRLAER